MKKQISNTSWFWEKNDLPTHMSPSIWWLDGQESSHLPEIALSCPCITTTWPAWEHSVQLWRDLIWMILKVLSNNMWLYKNVSNEYILEVHQNLVPAGSNRLNPQFLWSSGSRRNYHKITGRKQEIYFTLKQLSYCLCFSTLTSCILSQPSLILTIHLYYSIKLSWMT